MNIEHLYEFIELSRQLNFTSTAKALHMTQPALSNHLQVLEKETGVLLLERSSKDTARLTPAGQCFLDMAKKVVALHAETLPRLKELQHAIEGKIVIRSPRHEYSAPFLDFVFEFQQSHPNIDIVLCPWVDADGIDDVASGAVDCAYIGYGNSESTCMTDDAEIELVPYCSVELVLWLDKEHPLATADPLSIKDLDGQALLIPANKKHDSWVIGLDNIMTRYGIACEINEKYCDSLEDFALTKAVCEDLVLCDANLVNFPPFQVRKDRVVRRFSPKVVGHVSVAHRRDEKNPAMQLFVSFLRDKFSSQQEDAVG